MSLLRLLLLFALIPLGCAEPAGGHVLVSIWSKTLDGYKWTRSNGGGFKPESYALSLGGRVEGTIESSLGREQIGRLAIAVLSDQGSCR